MLNMFNVMPVFHSTMINEKIVIKKTLFNEIIEMIWIL